MSTRGSEIDKISRAAHVRIDNYYRPPSVDNGKTWSLALCREGNPETGIGNEEPGIQKPDTGIENDGRKIHFSKLFQTVDNAIHLINRY